MNRRPDLRDVAAIFVHNALVALGHVPDPSSGEHKTDLDSAQMAIELLEVIEERTRANRTEDEEHFLLQALTQLRLGYVQLREARTTTHQSPPPDAHA
ncbi:MAG: DUF1844 domain-containing protein [Chlorobi bacterium]|nr:DUF1844 domain-containing protein [Chlorobiota bacterium]